MGAYQAGQKTREAFGEARKHSNPWAGVDAVFPAAPMIRAVMPSLSDFARGVMGSQQPAPERGPAPVNPLAAEAYSRGQQRAAAKPAAASARPAISADPFDRLISAVASANGGKISIGQMSALADMVGKTTPARARPPSGRDQAITEGMSVARQMYEVEASQAKARGDQEGYLNAYQKYGQTINLLAGTGASDQMMLGAEIERLRNGD